MATPDRLSEALLGLCVLAAKGHNDVDFSRLVEQFRKNYPEIILLEDRQAETIRYTEKSLRQLGRIFHAEDLRKAVPAAFARRAP
jgi:ABC-type enterochelin transport system substrate-binding protein